MFSRLQKLTAKLGKISNAQEMKEKKIAEKSEQIKEVRNIKCLRIIHSTCLDLQKLESKLNHAEENKKKHMDEVKDKVTFIIINVNCMQSIFYY